MSDTPKFPVRINADMRLLSVTMELDAINEPHAILPRVEFHCAVRTSVGMPEDHPAWPGGHWQKITLELRPDRVYVEELLEKLSRMASILVSGRDGDAR